MNVERKRGLMGKKLGMHIEGRGNKERIYGSYSEDD